MPPNLADREHGSTLVLFDVDGTLAVPAQRADDAAVEMLGALRERYAVGIVGAGDFEKQTMQLHGDLHARLDFVFSENGVHAFRGGECLHCKSIVEHLGEARWAKFEATLERLLREARDEPEKYDTETEGNDEAQEEEGLEWQTDHAWVGRRVARELQGKLGGKKIFKGELPPTDRARLRPRAASSRDGPTRRRALRNYRQMGTG